MRMPSWNVIQWNIPGAISCTRRSLTGALPTGALLYRVRYILAPNAPAGETCRRAGVGTVRVHHERCTRGPAAARLDVDPGVDHRVRRHGPARGRPAPVGTQADRQDPGDRLDRAVLQPLGADRPDRPRRGHAVRPAHGERPLLALLRLH